MKVLAVSSNHGDPRPFLEEEAAHMRTLVESGRVTDLWVKADWSGAVLMMDTPDLEAARAAVDGLPLVRHGLTAFTLTHVVDPPPA